MPEFATDDDIRAEAFAHVRRLAANRGHLSSEDIKAGFQFRGQRVPLINPQRIEYFGEHRPASTLVEVSALVDSRLKVEIEAVAYIDD